MPFFFRHKSKKGSDATVSEAQSAVGGDEAHKGVIFQVRSPSQTASFTKGPIASPSGGPPTPLVSPPPPFQGKKSPPILKQEATAVRSPSQSQQGGVPQKLPLRFSGALSSKMPLPPGAKLISGPLPPGVKVMMKGPPLPSGMKLMKGPPPPGAKRAVFRRVDGSGGASGVLTGGTVGTTVFKSPRGTSPAPPAPATAAKKLVPAPSLSMPLSPRKSPSKSPSKSPPLSPQLKNPQKADFFSALTLVPTKSPSLKGIAAKPRGDKEVSSSSLDDKRKLSTFSHGNDNVQKMEESFRPNIRDSSCNSESDSELHFVVEGGSPEPGSPSLQESLKLKPESVLSKGLSTKFGDDEMVESVTSFYTQNDDLTGTQKCNMSRPCDRKVGGSIVDLHQTSLEGEKKEFIREKEINSQVVPSHHEEHETLLESMSSVEKKHLTPLNQKSMEKRSNSSSMYDSSPALLDHTVKKKHVQDLRPIYRTESSLQGKNEIQVLEGKLLGNIQNRIAEQFLSILCPQQFYGKVIKLHGIRSLKNDPERASWIKQYKTIFVATKGTLPNPFFYPQLLLTESDRSLRSNLGASEYTDTPIVLYEAAPGNMLFAETELEAKHIMESDSTVMSCFVLERSAIMFKDPLKYVLPIAMLTVQWIPYSVAGSEPQCPVHHKELQLFDRCTKELFCALCVSKNGSHNSDLVVIPEAFSGNSRRQVVEKLSQQLQQERQNAAHWVNKHQRIVSIAKHKKDAVNQQFELLIAAIKAKQEEFLEHCDIAFGFALSNVAKEILTEDEHMRLLKASIDHLRIDSTNPLYSMQVATVINALHSLEKFPLSLSFDSLEIPVLSNELTPNLETVMAEVQKLSPMTDRLGTRFADSSLHIAPVREREYVQQQDWGKLTQMKPKSLLLEQPPEIKETRLRLSQRRSQSHANGTRTSLWKPRTSSRRRSLSLVPHYSDNQFALNGGQTSIQRSKQRQWVAIPGCHGTCVLDTPIHELLANSDDMKSTHARPKYLQWVLRVEDPGEWVGIGVGVGGNIRAWSACRTPDLSHLWVVTCDDTQHKFMLRVTVNPSVGHAKLSIHDWKGRRLDDGRIPQWNAARSCYPQVTFGGRIGEVHLADGPRFVSN